MTLDDRAVVWSAGENDRDNRPLLVLLHGFGSDESDLFSLSPYLPLRPVIASLRAPFREGGGYAWFSRDSEPDAVDVAAEAVLDWMTSHAGAPASVGVLGFSQGAAVAVQMLRLAPERLDYVVALAGYVARDEKASDARLAEQRPPIFWGRGTNDTVIAEEAVRRTEHWLAEHAYADVRVYEGLTHAVNATELADVSGFINGR